MAEKLIPMFKTSKDMHHRLNPKRTDAPSAAPRRKAELPSIPSALLASTFPCSWTFASKPLTTPGTMRCAMTWVGGPWRRSDEVSLDEVERILI